MNEEIRKETVAEVFEEISAEDDAEDEIADRLAQSVHQVESNPDYGKPKSYYEKTVSEESEAERLVEETLDEALSWGDEEEDCETCGAPVSRGHEGPTCPACSEEDGED